VKKGESEMDREKKIIGKLKLVGINNEKRGVKKIEVKLEIDEKGIVKV
jgi:molecular chaperone DnaK (HSP70)